MAVDYSRFLPGGTGLTSPQAPGQSTLVYNPANPANNVPPSGADYNAMYNAYKGKTDAFVSPFDTFDMAGLTATGMADPKTQIVNTGRSLQDVYDEAQAEYLARATEQRGIARQGIQAAGQDRFQQARLAMEQQRGLSDTRGLTAGAAEGATAQLSAAQQVAINQIESQTRSELLNLKAQGVQDEFLGQEYATRKLEQFKQTDPQWGRLESLSRDYQDAVTRGDGDAAKVIRQQMADLEGELMGFANVEGYTPASSTMSLEDLDANVTALAEQVTRDPSLFDKIASAGLFVAGGGLLVASIIGTPFSGGLSAGAIVPAVAMMAAAAGAFSAGTYISAVEVDQEMSVPEKKAKIDAAYTQERARLLELGYPATEVDRIITEARAALPPALR